MHENFITQYWIHFNHEHIFLGFKAPTLMLSGLRVLSKRKCSLKTLSYLAKSWIELWSVQKSGLWNQDPKKFTLQFWKFFFGFQLKESSSFLLLLLLLSAPFPQQTKSKSRRGKWHSSASASAKESRFQREPNIVEIRYGHEKTKRNMNETTINK